MARDVQRELMSEVLRHGAAARVVSIRRLPDLLADIQALREDGIVSEGLFKTYLNGFEYDTPGRLPQAGHVVVLAYPDPITEVEFSWAGKAHRVIIPPTYLPIKVKNNLRQLVADTLEIHGYQTVGARLPLKTLAVRSGLGQYGRNNICYVPGMGSFFRLEAFYTDAPLQEDAWEERTMMDACAGCSACQESCPTASISADRFVIRAERCLTYMNELKGNFPEWVQPAWHNALIGCMRCQIICPQNAPYLKNFSIGETFVEDETAAILAADTMDQLSSTLRAKLQRIDWGPVNHTVMQRNLKELL